MSSSLTNSGEETILSNQISVHGSFKREIEINDYISYFNLESLARWLRIRCCDKSERERILKSDEISTELSSKFIPSTFEPIKRIVIQVPDEFVEFSASIVGHLQNALNGTVFPIDHLENKDEIDVVCGSGNSCNCKEQFEYNNQNKTNSNKYIKNTNDENHDFGDLEDIEGITHDVDSFRNKNSIQSEIHGDAQIQPSSNLDSINKYVHISIMADTSYGSCCVDEITASKIQADCIIHLGSTKCLSKISSKVSLVNISGNNEQFNVNKCWEHLKSYSENGSERVVVLYELQYWNKIVEELLPLVNQEGLENKIQIAKVDASRVIQNDPFIQNNQQNQINLENYIYGPFSQNILVDQKDIQLKNENIRDINGLQFNYEEDEEIKFFYIGKESNHLSQIMLEFNEASFTRYDGNKNIFDNAEGAFSKIRNMVRRRYYLMEKAKDANTFGILIATVTIKNYMDIVKRIQNLLKENGKQYYMFFVGKVNVPKLANFSEIDMYILVSCGQNSVIDTKEFFTPIITPYELEVALGGQLSWEGKIVTEFDNLLKVVDQLPEKEKQEYDEEAEPRFSIITGTYVGTNVVDKEDSTHSGHSGNALVKAQDKYDLVSQSNAVAYFHEKRSFKGLEQNIGQTPISEAEIGLSGIPKNYESEKNH